MKHALDVPKARPNSKHFIPVQRPHPTLTSNAQIPFSISFFATEKPEVTVQMGNYSKFGTKGCSGLPINHLSWLFIGS